MRSEGWFVSVFVRTAPATTHNETARFIASFKKMRFSYNYYGSKVMA